MVEALSSLIYSAVSLNLFKGIKVGYEEVSVSHLQFANDTIIFCESDMGQILNVKRVLRCFQVMYGLNINFLKSCIFEINVEMHTLMEWADKICYNVNVLPSTYLGLPFGAKDNSVRMWESIVEKFERRLARWKSNLLSMGGRVTMIKFILACLPIYFMSLFRIPSIIKDKLIKIQKRFLWEGSGSSRKIHWVDWNSVCNLKDNGGLGIMDVSIKNRALLNKWVWRYGEEPCALWRVIIASKYGGCHNGFPPRLGRPQKYGVATDLFCTGVIGHPGHMFLD